jgi:hypothetical protein
VRALGGEISRAEGLKPESKEGCYRDGSRQTWLHRYSGGGRVGVTCTSKVKQNREWCMNGLGLRMSFKQEDTVLSSNCGSIIRPERQDMETTFLHPGVFRNRHH